ncbi:MAG: ribose 5-phosphate isomerase B [Elusimicrobia bacterium]|nr:ribose 5-phosphate isomerase B [Elusimicrobiota bacterium]
MVIAFGCDHAGYSFKEKIIMFLKTQGYKVVDYGCFDDGSVDYPDFATAVARCVSKGTCDTGVLICGTGIGMCITANKFRGVRAAVAYSTDTAELAKRHNNANILCVGARSFKVNEIIEFIDVWLKASFEGGRHGRRVDKISNLEDKNIK